MSEPTQGKKLNAIEKALEIMLRFQETKPSWGIRELSGQLGFSPATVQRILKTLKAYEFVCQDEKTRQYAIGNVFYRFLENLNNSNDLARTGRKFMEEVAQKTQETVHLNIIQGYQRICIDTIESPQTLKAGMPIGNQSPLYAGASAKCLLAFSTDTFKADYFKNVQVTPLTANTIVVPLKLQAELDKIQDKGFARSMGERTPGLGSLSTPVFDYKGTVLASMSLAIPEIRFQEQDHLSTCIQTLTRASQAFSRAMGLHTPNFTPPL
ncbi:MAG: IclR family transcriptional regulator [Desulfobacterales bacterium]|nr:IclR family transcriptional regulator [Desulfobacterales bacterium]